MRNATVAGAGYRLPGTGFTPTLAQWRNLAARARMNGGEVFVQVQGRDSAQRRTESALLRVVIE